MFDVDSIPLGVDFRDYLDEQVSTCDVLLAVIGNEWLDILARRADDPNDFVRIEIEAALKRNIRVIPVLVENAKVPSEQDLPEQLKALAFRNAAEFRGGKDTKSHLRRLAGGLEDLFGGPAKASHSPVETLKQNAEGLNLFSDRLKDDSQGPEMVILPTGEFLMGSDPAKDSAAESHEQPQHRVIIAKPFAIARYPVTFAEFDCFAKSTDRELPEDRGWGRENRPVINVSWQDVKDYVAWLAEQTGREYRLPSEAEWEYACRAGTESLWFWGSQKKQGKDFAWFSTNSKDKTQPVGKKKPNPWGLSDMSGNVWEWVEDCWHSSYEGAPDDGRAWLEGNPGPRVLRGGSWYYDPDFLRSSNRGRGDPANRPSYLGFRVVCRPH